MAPEAASTFSLFASAVHVRAAVIWVGGMFFAYMVLRTALGPLDPRQRLELWSPVLPRFFAWVWAAVIALPATGYGQVFIDFGGSTRRSRTCRSCTASGSP